MKGINVIGTILGGTGYDSHTRGLVNALMKFTEVKLITNIPAGMEIHLNDRELNAVKNTKEYDTNLIITNPSGWRMHSTNKVNIVYFVWEGDKIPLSFIDEILNPEIKYVIVPSKHTYDAIINTANTVEAKNHKVIEYFSNKLKIIPHGVNLEKFYPMEKPKDKFRFFANKGFRNLEDRGGIQYLIKAFSEEFKANENIELVIKINPSYGIPNIHEIMSKLGNKEGAQIRFITDFIKYEDLVKIYNQCHAFVSPTRAEAFNIPCLEACACGLPVITTNFGGQTDFIDNSNGWVIGGELTEVKHELQYEGIKWLTPDIGALKVAMRQAFEDTRLTEEKSSKALETAKLLTWDNSAQNLIFAIENR